MFRILMSLTLLSSVWTSSLAIAHPGHSHRKLKTAPTNNVLARTDAENQAEMDVLAVNELPQLLAQLDQQNSRVAADKVPDMAKAFEAFVKLKAINTRWDDRFFFVESNGIPDHRLMVGITAWQQQVPIPQKYLGNNAWQIPLHPVPAKNPRSAKGNFLRGAIALAANGVPIFALSAEPKLSPDTANRAGLLEAIKDLTLAEGTLDFQYERKR